MFVEDTVVVFPDPAGADLAVLTHPGAASRRGEVASVARALGALGDPAPRVARITPPGTLDGGDVLKVGRTAVVDLGGGAVVLSADAPHTAALLRARGLDVVPVPITEFEKVEGCVTCLSVRLRPGDVRSAAPARAPATP